MTGGREGRGGQGWYQRASTRALGWLLGLLLLGATPAVAEPLLRPLYPQDRGPLDLILRTSDDADLLTPRQSALRQKMIDLGVDPRGVRERISLATLLRRRFADGAGQILFEPPRLVEILEVHRRSGLILLFRFPETHLFFSDVDTNRVGVTFEAPRDMRAAPLRVSVDGVDAWQRQWVAVGLQDKWREQIRTRKSRADQQGELLNFTIPLKLPRTLERFIGRGEATNIRISGQESISISGESTRRSDFQANEIRQSQSLFPTLEMKQTLRVTLDGTVGEKIKVRVTHDSEAIGTQGTEVKLAFEGDEDDIIQTIRAGDIDVTLPGSRLLGVGATKGGLFGIKVEGALGPLDFTVVTSKEQSQQNRQNFNQSGGTEESYTIPSTDYIKNRFFRLMAPFPLFFQEEGLRDDSQFLFVEQGYAIDVNTLELYLSFSGSGISDENTFEKGYAFLDTGGVGWEDANLDPASFDAATALAGIPFEESPRWKRLQQGVDWDPLFSDDSGAVIGIALRRSLQDGEALATAYLVLEKPAAQGGVPVRRVGRLASSEEPYITGVGTDPTEPVHFFKLLKPRYAFQPFDPTTLEPHPFALTWEYAYRHYYDLKGRGIEPASLSMRIERSNSDSATPELDTENDPPLPWFQVFGLDRQQNASGVAGPDGQVDVTDAAVFNLNLGYVQFPTLTPFDPPAGFLQEWTQDASYVLADDLRAPQLYREDLNAQNLSDAKKFNLVVTHTSTSSRFRLNAFNIKEGSEEVLLDGRPLRRGEDYSIDYFSGEINLIDQPLDAQSNIQVSFEVDPLFGGGRTSLHGFNLGYELGRRKTLSTTWLLQSKPNNATKPRLGEEPSKNWVGNVAAKLQFQPGFVTRLSNVVSREDSDENSTINLDAEVAISVPNPNTQGQAYLEDFESVDESVLIGLSREGWAWASLPAEYEDGETTRKFGPEDRAYAGWHRAVPGVKRGDLNPTLSEQERRDVVTAMEMRLESASDEFWQPGEFAGIMRGLGGDADLSQTQFIEFWVNDYTGDPEFGIADNPREGILHFDFGIVNEDSFWPVDGEGERVLGTFEFEDRDNDGLLRIDSSVNEDVGLDGIPSSQETQPIYPQRPAQSGDPGGDNFDATPDAKGESDIFLYINGTEDNQRLDTEDMNRDGVLERRDGYFTLALDLADTNAIVDIYRDYADWPEFIDYSRSVGNAWRKYRLDLRNLQTRQGRGLDPDDPYTPATPDLSRVRYLRIWYENPDGVRMRDTRRIVFTEMRFLGNRWLADNLRDLEDVIVPPSATEDFRVGVVNNKENPEYRPPVFPDTRNNVAEKEQSLQLTYSNLEPGHQLRVRKDIPGTQGQDFSVYGELNFFWRAPYRDGVLDDDQQYLEAYYWVGTDSTSYYEIAVPFQDMDLNVDDWQECRVDLGEMTNLKATGREEPLFPGSTVTVRRGELQDRLTGEVYRITVRGRPDLRRVRRFYAGVRHPLRLNESGQVIGVPVSGEVLFNEIRLKEVNREVGYAKRVASNATIPGLGEFSVEWSETDAEFRGLNQSVGSGVLRRDWSARASSKLQNLIPLLGFDVPFQLNMRRSLALPKYLTSSDVELLTDEERQAEKTEDTSESFNFQLRRPNASRSKLLNYTLDRFTFSLSGTRSERVSPTDLSNRKSADSKYTYDLRVPRGFELKIPFTRKKVRYLPNQLTLGSSWRYDEQRRTDLVQQSDGTRRRVLRDPVVNKTVTNNLSLSQNVVRSLRLNFSVSSLRNIVGREEWTFLGVNWGQEETHNERFSFNWAPEIRLLRWLKPTLDYSAGYQENRRPGVRQRAGVNDVDGNDDGLLGQPGAVRNINNNNDISVRGQVNLLGWFQRKFKKRPERAAQPSTRTQERRERGRLDRSRRREEAPPPPPAEETPAEETPAEAPTDSVATDAGEVDDTEAAAEDELQPEEGETADEAWLRQQEEDRLRREREEELRREQERMEAIQRGEDPDAIAAGEQEQDVEAEEGEPDPGAAFLKLLSPFKNLVLNLQPVSASYQRQNQSNYQHVGQRASLAYRLGFSRDPGVGSDIDDGIDVRDGDRAWSSYQVQKSDRVNLSTQTQLSENVRLDMSFNYTRRVRDGTTGKTRDYTVEWPTASMKISRVNEWGIFGDVFASSNIDVNIRKMKSATGVTDQSENPKHTFSISPRWTFRFRNGLDTNVNVNYQRDRTENNISTLRNNRINGNVKFRKSFDAEGRLGFLRFGKKGTGSTIDMSIDLNYTRNKSDRLLANAEFPDQPRGNERIAVAPSFSYQFSRNLRGGLNLNYSRTTDLARDNAVTTSLGLGLNATLNF